MRSTRTTSVLLATMLAIVLGSSGAAAQYQPATGTLTLSASAAVAGSSITASGEGCAPDATATIDLDGDELDQAMADADGAVEATVEIPADTEPGDHTLSLTCAAEDGGTQVLSATLTVTDEDGLSDTGTDVAWLWIPAVLLIVFGIALITVQRRRHDAAA